MIFGVLGLLCRLFVDSVLYLALIVLGRLFLCFVDGLVCYLVCCADLLLCFVCCDLVWRLCLCGCECCAGVAGFVPLQMC